MPDKRLGWVFRTPVPYTWSSGFDYRFGDYLSWIRTFVIFSSPSRKILRCQPTPHILQNILSSDIIPVSISIENCQKLTYSKTFNLYNLKISGKTNQPTKNIALSPSSEAASCAATQEFPNISCNPNFRCRIRNSLPLVPVVVSVILLLTRLIHSLICTNKFKLIFEWGTQNTQQFHWCWHGKIIVTLLWGIAK
jgi:hypothetical protein